MKVVITGAEGFIGSNFFKYLKSRNYDVTGIDKVGNSEVSQIDIKDYISLSKFLNDTQPDIVVHLAANAYPALCEKNNQSCFEDNVLGTLNIARISRELKYKIVFASSAAVYGEPRKTPISTTDDVHPTNFYGLTKAIGEQLIRFYSENYVIFRIFNVYGEGCNRSYVIPDTIRQIYANENPIRKMGTGTELRDFVYIEDVCRVFETAIGRNEIGTFNVGTGHSISIKDLVDKILDIMRETGREVEFAGTKRTGDINTLIADVSGGNIYPRWAPKFDLTTGLKKTIASYR